MLPIHVAFYVVHNLFTFHLLLRKNVVNYVCYPTCQRFQNLAYYHQHFIVKAWMIVQIAMVYGESMYYVTE